MEFVICVNIARYVDAKAFIGPHEEDLPRIHTSERAYIKGYIGTGGFKRTCRFAGVIGDAVLSRNHMHAVFRPEFPINFRGSCIDVQFIHRVINRISIAVIGAIASPCDFDSPFLYIKTIQAAICDDRLSCGKDGASHIDEAESISNDAIGIGNHKVCFLSCHFHEAVQVRIPAACHFSKNKGRRFSIESGIGCHRPGELRLRVLHCVIEDKPLFSHIEICELVMG